MNPNRFHLPKRSRKTTCPHCGKAKCFRPYVDAETGKILADFCGICDHVNSCGYHNPPRQLFHDYPELKRELMENDSMVNGQRSILFRHAPKYLPAEPVEYVQTEFFPDDWPVKAMNRESTFVRWFRWKLSQLGYPKELIEEVLEHYYVGGTANDIIKDGLNHGPAVVFWMIDEKGRTHDAKLIAYKSDGHRVPDWANSMRAICKKSGRGPQFEETEKTLFGLHLLNCYPDKPIAIVESEKSALICALRYPDYLWMATGGCSNLQSRKLRPLLNRRLVLFPDSGMYDKWQKLMEQSGHQNYTIVDTLEQYESNTDLADLILGEARLKATEPKECSTEEPSAEKAPSQEEEVLQQMIAKHEGMAEIIEQLDLVIA